MGELTGELAERFKRLQEKKNRQNQPASEEKTASGELAEKYRRLQEKKKIRQSQPAPETNKPGDTARRPVTVRKVVESPVAKWNSPYRFDKQKKETLVKEQPSSSTTTSNSYPTSPRKEPPAPSQVGSGRSTNNSSRYNRFMDARLSRRYPQRHQNESVRNDEVPEESGTSNELKEADRLSRDSSGVSSGGMSTETHRTTNTQEQRRKPVKLVCHSGETTVTEKIAWKPVDADPVTKTETSTEASTEDSKSDDSFHPSDWKEDGTVARNLDESDDEKKCEEPISVVEAMTAESFKSQKDSYPETGCSKELSGCSKELDAILEEKADIATEAKDEKTRSSSQSEAQAKEDGSVPPQNSKLHQQEEEEEETVSAFEQTYNAIQLHEAIPAERRPLQASAEVANATIGETTRVADVPDRTDNHEENVTTRGRADGTINESTVTEQRSGNASPNAFDQGAAPLQANRNADRLATNNRNTPQEGSVGAADVAMGGSRMSNFERPLRTEKLPSRSTRAYHRPHTGEKVFFGGSFDGTAEDSSVNHERNVSSDGKDDTDSLTSGVPSLPSKPSRRYDDPEDASRASEKMKKRSLRRKSKRKSRRSRYASKDSDPLGRAVSMAFDQIAGYAGMQEEHSVIDENTVDEDYYSDESESIISDIHDALLSTFGCSVPRRPNRHSNDDDTLETDYGSKVSSKSGHKFIRHTRTGSHASDSVTSYPSGMYPSVTSYDKTEATNEDEVADEPADFNKRIVKNGRSVQEAPPNLSGRFKEPNAFDGKPPSIPEARIENQRTTGPAMPVMSMYSDNIGTYATFVNKEQDTVNHVEDTNNFFVAEKANEFVFKSTSKNVDKFVSSIQGFLHNNGGALKEVNKNAVDSESGNNKAVGAVEDDVPTGDSEGIVSEDSSPPQEFGKESEHFFATPPKPSDLESDNGSERTLEDLKMLFIEEARSTTASAASASLSRKTNGEEKKEEDRYDGFLKLRFGNSNSDENLVTGEHLFSKPKEAFNALDKFAGDKNDVTFPRSASRTSNADFEADFSESEQDNESGEGGRQHIFDVYPRESQLLDALVEQQMEPYAGEQIELSKADQACSTVGVEAIVGLEHGTREGIVRSANDDPAVSSSEDGPQDGADLPAMLPRTSHFDKEKFVEQAELHVETPTEEMSISVAEKMNSLGVKTNTGQPFTELTSQGLSIQTNVRGHQSSETGSAEEDIEVTQAEDLTSSGSVSISAPSASSWTPRAPIFFTKKKKFFVSTGIEGSKGAREEDVPSLPANSGSDIAALDSSAWTQGMGSMEPKSEAQTEGIEIMTDEKHWGLPTVSNDCCTEPVAEEIEISKEEKLYGEIVSPATGNNSSMASWSPVFPSNERFGDFEGIEISKEDNLSGEFVSPAGNDFSMSSWVPTFPSDSKSEDLETEGIEVSKEEVSEELSADTRNSSRGSPTGHVELKHCPAVPVEETAKSSRQQEPAKTPVARPVKSRPLRNASLDKERSKSLPDSGVVQSGIKTEGAKKKKGHVLRGLLRAFKSKKSGSKQAKASVAFPEKSGDSEQTPPLKNSPSSPGQSANHPQVDVNKLMESHLSRKFDKVDEEKYQSAPTSNRGGLNPITHTWLRTPERPKYRGEREDIVTPSGTSQAEMTHCSTKASNSDNESQDISSAWTTAETTFPGSRTGFGTPDRNTCGKWESVFDTCNEGFELNEERSDTCSNGSCSGSHSADWESILEKSTEERIAKASPADISPQKVTDFPCLSIENQVSF